MSIPFLNDPAQKLLTALGAVAFCTLVTAAPEARAAEAITTSQYDGTLQQALDQAGEGAGASLDIDFNSRFLGISHQARVIVGAGARIH